MADKELTCKVCNDTFIFTEREQAFYSEKGFTDPQSCQPCRVKRKAERQGGQRNFRR